MNTTAVGVVELAGGLDLVTARHGVRSARVQSELRRHWKEVVKRQPPATREKFLDSPDGRTAIGAATCKQLLKTLRARAESVAGGFASPAAALDWMLRDELPAGLKFDDRDHLVAGAGCKLVLSAAGVRNGVEHPEGTDPAAAPIAGVPSRRWTPPQAVELEDYIDGMEPMEAATESMAWPVSGSSHALQWIRIRRGVCVTSEPTVKGGEHRG